MKPTLLPNFFPGINSLYITHGLCTFAFYSIKSIFVLYAINQLSLDEKDVITLFATFMSLCYATSLIGGAVADKVLGVRNAILMGGFLSFSGMLCFALPSQETCYFGLILTSLGSGFFKPNLSTAVGLFFENQKDPKKDKAYYLYYMATNVGSLLAPLVIGFICTQYGWNYGILLISATLLGATYLFYKRVHFPIQSEKKNKLSNNQVFCLGLFIFFLFFLCYLLFKYNNTFHGLMGIISVGSFVYLGRIIYRCNSQERKDMGFIILSIILFTFFCSLFEQAGSSLILFFEHAVDRNFHGFIVPSSAFLSLGPLFVLICSPALIFLSSNYFEKTKPMSEFFKMGLGFLFVSASFLILALSTYNESLHASPWWVVGALLIQTLGELWIVPIGFSTVSKYAPQRFRSVMMSFWLMAIAYGHYFAGFIAQYASSKPLESSATALDRYGSFFFTLSLLPMIVAVILLLYSIIRKYEKTS